MISIRSLDQEVPTLKLTLSIKRRNRHHSRTVSQNGKRTIRRSLSACLICLSLISGFLSPALAAKGRKPAAKKSGVRPSITEIQFEKLAVPAGTKKKTIPLTVEIDGKRFGKTLT